MPKLLGVFDIFKDLDQIIPEDIAKWLPTRVKNADILNFIGNKILYPQTVPPSLWDLELELAILREAIKRHPETVYFKALKNSNELDQIIIPTEFILRFTNLNKLISAMIEGLNPQGNVLIYAKNNQLNVDKSKQYKFLATIVTSVVKQEVEAVVTINDSQKILKVSKSHIFPVSGNVNIKIGNGKQFSVIGGETGVIIYLKASEGGIN